MNSYYVYILASKQNGTLYIGVTNDLARRVNEHKQGEVEGFTQEYSVNKLVYYDETSDVHEAIDAEKRMKKWKREWKLNLIDEFNPTWTDLYEEIVQDL